MFPILFTIGKVAVRSYTILLDLGLVAGLAVAYWLWRRQGRALQLFLDASTWSLLGALVGGRAAYVGANWAYFSQHLSESLAIWSGGMSFHGAFAGGGLALLVHALASRRSLWEMADVLTSGLSAASIFGWLACFAAGCAYGIVGDGALFLLSPDVYGLEAPRFASQLIGAAHSLVVLAILLGILWLGARPGTAACAYLILYFGGQFGLEFLRGDESLFVGPWRLAQAVDAAFVFIGIVALLFVRARVPRLAPAGEQRDIVPRETASDNPEEIA